MYNHILVPIALDHIDHANESLEVARRLLNDDGTITMINVIEDIPAFAETYLPDGALNQNEANAHDMLDSFSKSEGHGYAAHVVHGKPSLAILEYAQNNGSDCIIIASHKPGLEDYFIGSTASRVVRHAKCCVHVLR